MTKSYKEQYLDYCTGLCDCVTKKAVRRHNAAMKQLRRLYHQVEGESDKSFLLELLQCESDRTRALVAAHCLGYGIYIAEAEKVLSLLAKNKGNPILAFEAQATLDVWKQQGYLQF